MLASGPSALSLLIWEVESNSVIVFFTEHLRYVGQSTESFTNAGSGTYICGMIVRHLLRNLARPWSQEHNNNLVIEGEFVREPRSLSSTLALSLSDHVALSVAVDLRFSICENGMGRFWSDAFKFPSVSCHHCVEYCPACSLLCLSDFLDCRLELCILSRLSESISWWCSDLLVILWPPGDKKLVFLDAS